MLGLDEAGRGSVIGPLVVGAFLWAGEDQATLRLAGADDSKALSARRRVAIRERLGGLGHGQVVSVSAVEIDGGNLNELEIRAFVALAREHRPDRVYLDAPVNPRGIPALRARLIAETGVADWVVEPRADATWPVVGAASIFAKVARDAAIAELAGVGSGYPSDPVTRAHLRALLAGGAPLPAYVRSRWATIGELQQEGLFPGLR